MERWRGDSHRRRPRYRPLAPLAPGRGHLARQVVVLLAVAHVPSIPLQRCTRSHFTPASFSRSRLFSRCSVPGGGRHVVRDRVGHALAPGKSRSSECSSLRWWRSRYSAGSKVCSATSSASAPRRRGVVTLEHVRTRRLGHDDILPARTSSARAATFCRADFSNSATLPWWSQGRRSTWSLGEPSRRCRCARRHRRGRADRRLHVLNEARREHSASFVVGRLDGLCHLNHVVNRCGRRGAGPLGAMPTVFSMALRLSEPGDPVSLFTTGDASTDTFPSRSVRPRNWSVSFSFTGCLHGGAARARAS